MTHVILCYVFVPLLHTFCHRAGADPLTHNHSKMLNSNLKSLLIAGDAKHLQEVKTLRSEIKKMGTEGVKLLEQREKEILEMRGHLKNVLKVMETKSRVGLEPLPVE